MTKGRRARRAAPREPRPILRTPGCPAKWQRVAQASFTISKSTLQPLKKCTVSIKADSTYFLLAFKSDIKIRINCSQKEMSNTYYNLKWESYLWRPQPTSIWAEFFSELHPRLLFHAGFGCCLRERQCFLTLPSSELFRFQGESRNYMTPWQDLSDCAMENLGKICHVFQ